jgi:putative hydrolases of HD superfamily
MAILLAEHANEPVDVCKVTKMLLVHDLVEIDAGDTFLYDDAANVDKRAKYAQAIDRWAPCLLNLVSNGSAWVKNGVSYTQAYEKNAKVAEGSEILWQQAQTLLLRARSQGFLK